MQIKGITREQLSSVTKIPFSTVASYVKASGALPRIDKAEKIARALGVDLQELLVKEDPEKTGVIIEGDSFGSRLTALLQSRNITVTRLAELTDIPRETISSYINAKTVNLPRVDNALRIAEVLGVSVEDLVTSKQVSVMISRKSSYLWALARELDAARGALLETHRKLSALLQIKED